MTGKQISFYQITLYLLGGFLTTQVEGTIKSFDSNTPVRVLLDRAIPKGKVQSVLYSTFYRGKPERGWITGPREVFIDWKAEARPSIRLNNQTLGDSFVYIRGGKSPSDKISFQGKLYRGALKWSRKKNSFTVVNYVSLDDYLLGTLGSEMSALWEMEALKAQAVASRTYALYMLQHPRHSDFDLDHTTQDQVYGGVLSEHPRVQEAVESTAGQILTFQEKPIKSFFHSRCGGSTETPAFVWNHSKGYPQRKVPCAFCLKNPFSWEAEVSAEELLSWTGLTSALNIRLEPGRRGESGRLASLHVHSGNQRATIDTDSLRSHLGYTRLKSAKFDWRHEKDRVRFEGVGNGHGVGMCQWGARFLAQQGKNYRQILAHYYPGTSLIVSR